MLETSAKGTRQPEKYSSRCFRRGNWVQIRSEEEILATLDAEGKLGGLAFMPEMAKYCGSRFRIYRRAEHVFLDHHYFVVRLKNTVLLETLRCDGSAHGGCEMNCLMFWKEAWLRPATPPVAEENLSSAPRLITLTNKQNIDDRNSDGPRKDHPNLSQIFACQATEIARIGRRLSGWDPRQYLRDVLYRDQSIVQIWKMWGKQALNKWRRIFPRKNERTPSRKASKPLGTPLNLQPGEWVEVKSLAEITETLSSDNRLRGLGFSPDMAPFCGKRFRVTRRVERMILEWSGEMKQLRDTVALDTVHCDGCSYRACPRNCFLLWREDWLKRVAQDA